MNTELVLFILLALVAVASALGMLVSRNAIYSALYLILNFSVIAVFYLLLGAPFIAMAQITVYAGAIMVLFLFVIMLLGGIGQPHPREINRWQLPVAIVLGLILAGEVVFIVIKRVNMLPGIGNTNPDFASPKAIGDLLFTQYLLPFEITSVLLLVAMVGAIVLTQVQPKRKM